MKNGLENSPIRSPGGSRGLFARLVALEVDHAVLVLDRPAPVASVALVLRGVPRDGADGALPGSGLLEDRLDLLGGPAIPQHLIASLDPIERRDRPTSSPMKVRLDRPGAEAKGLCPAPSHTRRNCESRADAFRFAALTPGCHEPGDREPDGSSSRSVLRISLFQNRSQRGRAFSAMMAFASPTALLPLTSNLAKTSTPVRFP